jgi:hypothetical protein
MPRPGADVSESLGTRARDRSSARRQNRRLVAKYPAKEQREETVGCPSLHSTHSRTREDIRRLWMVAVVSRSEIISCSPAFSPNKPRLPVSTFPQKGA